MKRRTRTIVFLLSAAALLGAAVYAELRHERALARDPLSRIDLEQARTLEIRCEGCATRRFEKVDGRWRMLEPQVAAADEAAVRRLLAIATAPVRLRHPADQFEASKVGLSPPRATLRIDETTLAFGDTDAIHGDRYVATGDEIALVPDRFSALLFEPADREIADRTH